MPTFKTNDGRRHFLDRAEHRHLLPQDAVQLTDEEEAAERAAYLAALPSPRRLEITDRLTAIDKESTRALREAIIESANGRPVPAFAKNKLQTLENEAATLRAELAALNA